MGIFDWLLGPKEAPSRVPSFSWRLSENGNPTLLDGNVRFTVFPQDGGWKFVMADEDDEHEPYFSERYRSQEEAKAAAIDVIRRGS